MLLGALVWTRRWLRALAAQRRLVTCKFLHLYIKHWQTLKRSVNHFTDVCLVTCLEWQRVYIHIDVETRRYLWSSAKLDPICHSFLKSVIIWIKQLVTSRIWNWALVEGVGECSACHCNKVAKHNLPASCRENRWNPPNPSPAQARSIAMALYIVS